MKIKFATATIAALAWAGWLGCSAGQTAEKSGAAREAAGDAKMSIKVTSDAFAEGAAIPKKYTGDGEDVSPPLAWSGAPEGTKEFALVCNDPDAPSREPWVHWVLYKIQAGTQSLPEGMSRDPNPATPAGAMNGKSSWPKDNIGYRGPSPPKGKTHHYHFRLFALDVALDAKPKWTESELAAAMKGHVLAQGELVGTFEH